MRLSALTTPSAVQQIEVGSIIDADTETCRYEVDGQLFGPAPYLRTSDQASPPADGTLCRVLVPDGIRSLAVVVPVVLGEGPPDAAQTADGVPFAPAGEIEAENVQAALEDLDGRTADAGWVDITLEAGASAVSGWTPQYRLLHGVVRLRGLITTTDTGTVAWGSLPPGNRPGGQAAILNGIRSTGVSGEVRANTDGTLQLWDAPGGPTWTSLSGLSFPADA